MKFEATERNRGLVDLRNLQVQFKKADIYIPDPLFVLYKLHGNDLLCGRVVDITDSGMREGAFAVVRVEEIEQLIVVPVDRILRVHACKDRARS